MDSTEASDAYGALINRRISEIEMFSARDDAIVLRLDDGTRVYLMSAAADGQTATRIQAEIRA